MESTVPLHEALSATCFQTSPKSRSFIFFIVTFRQMAGCQDSFRMIMMGGGSNNAISAVAVRNINFIYLAFQAE